MDTIVRRPRYFNAEPFAVTGAYVGSPDVFVQVACVLIEHAEITSVYLCTFRNDKAAQMRGNARVRDHTR